MIFRYASDLHLEFGANSRYMREHPLEPRGDVEVFATTLWTRTDPRYYVTIQNGMNDCRAILYDGHAMWADDYAILHVACREWLDGALEASQARHKVVLTHHCPTTGREFCTRQVGTGLYSAFYVDMEPFIERHDIACWVYGHTHTQCGSGTVIPSMGGGTALLCNQLGYVGTGEHLNGFAGDRRLEL